MIAHDSINGSLERFIFKNEETGFCICTVRVQLKDTVTVRGHLAHLHPGESVILNGEWVTHPKFGRQFDAKGCIAQTPTTVLGLQKYLASGLIKGIGPAYAENLIKAFGTEVLEVISNNPERLQTVPGIGPKRAQTIIESWQQHKAVSHIMVFLQEKGVSPAYAAKIYKRYGTATMQVVTENPYRLAEEVWGIGFTIADNIARNVGIPTDSLKRVKAGILHIITTAVGNGNLYVELEAIRIQIVELLTISEEKKTLIRYALHELHNSNEIVLITHLDVNYITKRQYYYTELGVATQVKTVLTYPSLHTFDLNSIYTKLRTGNYGSLALHEDQQRGILSVLEHKVSIITGGPGTGKTTLIKTLLAVLDEQKVRYKLTAPTGKAAKRMHETTGKSSTTIHRLLEYDPSVGGFGKNEKNALNLDLLIVDESSMIDIFVAYALFKALPLHAHIVLIGDIDQLPSVGAGNVLADLIASGIIPTVKLTHIFRQAQKSLIVTNAHKVNNGDFITTHTDNPRPDFLFFKEQEPENLSKTLIRVYKALLPRYNIHHHNSITLSPMKKGIAGTHTLNHFIQEIINPGMQEQLSFHGFTYKVGDRVMQLKNNYETFVFNGDTGIITEIHVADGSLTVQFTDTQVTYTMQDLDEITPAYAISIHKSQGSEFDAVIIPLFMQHFMLLNRNLLYTAITRAKKLCIIIGQPNAVAIAIKNSLKTPRCTFLKEHLTTGVTCRMSTT